MSEFTYRSKGYWGYSNEFMAACRDELTVTHEELAASSDYWFVCEQSSIIIGYYSLAVLSDTDIELDALFVTPERIGRGVGRRLMEHAKHFAVTLGARRLIIQGDPHAESFYLAAGGVRTGERESESIPGRFLPLFEINFKG